MTQVRDILRHLLAPEISMRLLSTVLVLILAGLPARAEGNNAEARVYAAASLSDVVAALARRFEPIGQGRVIASYGASNTLVLQLHEGAAPGVFISASAEWVDKLDSWGLVEPGTRVDLAGIPSSSSFRSTRRTGRGRSASWSIPSTRGWHWPILSRSPPARTRRPRSKRRRSTTA
jgi:hypothetical protein